MVKTLVLSLIDKRSWRFQDARRRYLPEEKRRGRFFVSMEKTIQQASAAGEFPWTGHGGIRSATSYAACRRKPGH